ncbi:MAG: endonuclease/exonuclease/phosphatase family protein [Muribaculum sp.]|nr:endonuclease/exonuclease/phosphatase family protein [Muribaculum sp.]
MKIVSWNANCKFREKYKEVAKLGADVYVIQESENPETCKDVEYRNFVRNGFWIGGIPFKGLLVFSPSSDVKLELLDWKTQDYRYFLPIRVNDKFTLVGSWACDPYVQEFYDFIHACKSNLNENVIIIGDLNSNVVFDKDNIRTGKTHSIVVKELAELGLEDIYHVKTGDKQGQEKIPTFYLYRHLDKPFHIDHCFSNPKNIEKMTIHARWQWLALSDHLPIEITST